MPDQNEIGQVLFTAKKKKKPWKNGFYKMGELCLGLARVSGMCLICPTLILFLSSWSSLSSLFSSSSLPSSSDSTSSLKVRGPQQTFYQLKFLEHEDQSEQENKNMKL